MAQALARALGNYAQAHIRRDGLAPTAIAGLYTVRMSRTGELLQASAHPLVCLVGQGAKKFALGGRTGLLEAGDSMLLPPGIAAPASVVGASRAVPYLALALRPDPLMLAELTAEIGVVPGGPDSLTRAAPADHELVDTAARMVRLLDRPSALPVLQRQLRRELHYWLLAGRHGAMLRRAFPAKRHADRIARAVDLLRREFRSPLRAERLAEAAGIGLSAFYQSFRSVTALSPLQFQKQLRLAEARRQLLGQHSTVSEAAFDVGYESVSQFVREYRRAFGAPPAREVAQARGT